MNKQVAMPTVDRILAQVLAKRKDFLATVVQIIPLDEFWAIVRRCPMMGEKRYGAAEQLYFYDSREADVEDPIDI